MLKQFSVRPFRVHASSPGEAAMKAREKCPEEIELLTMRPVFGDWYEVLAKGEKEAQP